MYNITFMTYFLKVIKTLVSIAFCKQSYKINCYLIVFMTFFVKAIGKNKL